MLYNIDPLGLAATAGNFVAGGGGGAGGMADVKSGTDQAGAARVRRDRKQSVRLFICCSFDRCCTMDTGWAVRQPSRGVCCNSDRQVEAY